jgi:serine/threonine protein kinase
MPIEHAIPYVEKRLSSRERNEPEALAHFASEATLLSRLMPFGVTPRLIAHGCDDAGPWLRTERMFAPTIAEHLERAHGALAPAWIERAAHAALRAMAFLHEATDDGGPLGIVHADLSPSNLIIDEPGDRAFVLDFDLACWREGPPRCDGAFRGTIRYAAPEVARGETPTVRSDLFSLAAVMLHAMTGSPPRRGDSFAALLAEAAELPVRRPEHDSLAERGPFHASILDCLHHEPSARPPSARALLARASTG